MDFKKDILLIDLEMTGLDPAKQEIIQLGAILLDAKTLKEKKAFDTFVKPSKWKNRDHESMAVNKITWDQVKDAPSLKEVLKEFHQIFSPKKVVLAYYGGPIDMDFLRLAFKKAGIKWQFDYHFFNLWGLFFSYFAAHDKLKNNTKFTGFSLDDFIRNFKIKAENRHDALADCRAEAEVLRKVIANM
jgi:DNA polymerase-3 subunit epsilon